MPRAKEIESLTKVKINLFERDYERLKTMYPLQGPARVIRALVRAHVARIDGKALGSATNEIEIEIEDEELALDEA